MNEAEMKAEEKRIAELAQRLERSYLAGEPTPDYGHAGFSNLAYKIEALERWKRDFFDNPLLEDGTNGLCNKFILSCDIIHDLLTALRAEKERVRELERLLQGHIEAQECSPTKEPAMSNEYWREALLCALEEMGMPFPSDEHLKLGVNVLDGAHKNHGMAHGYDCIPNPQTTEIEKLSKELKREQSKVSCSHCNGSGRERYNSGPWAVDTQCWKCHGEGKVVP